MAAVEAIILKALENASEVFSLDLAEENKCNHQAFVGAGMSLEADGYVLSEVVTRDYWRFTPEALTIMKKGSPEYRLWTLLANGPLTQEEAEQKLGGKEVMAVALTNGMKQKRFSVTKRKQEKQATKTSAAHPFAEEKEAVSTNNTNMNSSNPSPDDKSREAKVATVEVTISRADSKSGEWNDAVRELLETLHTFSKKQKEEKNFSKETQLHVDPKDTDMLKKRKLAQIEQVRVFRYTRGPNYMPDRKGRAATDLSREMLLDGSWQSTLFKAYNFEGKGIETSGGNLHPLLKVRQEFREIFAEMGFQEMNTQQWVSSSFWNFDSLLIPQHHPSRDLQDTFFVSKPLKADLSKYDQKLIEEVKKEHERCFSSPWSLDESSTNILRTHTTGSSAYVLYKLYQDTMKTGTFRPGRYYSIDRVFRNEEMDRTHLCEFHQVEGFVIDRRISLAKMMHTFRYFFHRIGVVKLRFKPAFNPYTEPSMEIFGYHEKCGMWMEVGNSGLFRPELLKPLGFGEDIAVMAWGLSLERPTMIKYGLQNINQLFGHRVNLKFIKQAPLARF